ncbi:MAG TPA: YdeI/OmpD-associated family protein [Chitinophagaceae bacterium]|nr:YdeI/OmpD-associated family protein [Chitinophagaceae bacterium]
MAQELHKGLPVVQVRTRKQWRGWLAKNHDKVSSVWLIIFRLASGRAGLLYEDVVEEALCFGWIDSRPNKRDDASYYLLLSRRKPASKWSRANRLRARRMIDQGLMTAAGQAMIDLAKKAGTWEALEPVQQAVIPADLKEQFKKNKLAFKNFQAFPPSSKRIILEWILQAKRPATREQRIRQTVTLAARNIRANHYRQ